MNLYSLIVFLAMSLFKDICFIEIALSRLYGLFAVCFHYRAMHYVHCAFALYCYSISRPSACPSVRPSVCPSVTLIYRERMCWVSSKVIARMISLGSLLLGDPTSAI